MYSQILVNVFYSLSYSILLGLMVLHNLLKAIRASNTVIYYHEYSFEFYQKVYSVNHFILFFHTFQSPEIQLLLQLQELNKNALLPTTQINHLITPESPIKLPNSPHLDGNDLDLSTFDSMTHTNPYYNDNHTYVVPGTILRLMNTD